MSEAQVKPGDWVLFRRSYEPVAVDVREVAKVTPQLIKFERGGHPAQCSRLSVVASAPDCQSALKLKQSIDGVAGEFGRRRRAAEDERSRRVAEALTAANEQVRRIIEGAA